MGNLTERIRGDAQLQRVRRAHAGTILCRLLPASTTNSRLTSTGRAGNTDQPANGQARVESKSSDASSRHFKSPRAWASRATFGSGRYWLRVGD